jgi:hypothetical protein
MKHLKQKLVPYIGFVISQLFCKMYIENITFVKF